MWQKVRSLRKQNKLFLKDNKRWPLKQQAEFLSILAELLAAGFSLKRALEQLRLFFKHHGTKQVIDKLAEGSSFSVAMKAYLTPSLYCQLVIAEKHGQLEKSVTQLGRYLNLRIAQQEKLRAVLLYPLLLLGLLIFLLLGIKIWLIPEMTQFTPDKATKTTELGLKSIKFFLGGGALILGVYLLKTLYWLKHCGTLDRHSWYSCLPIVGKLYRQYCSYYMTFNLGLLIESGLEFHQICQLLQTFDKKTLLHQLGKLLAKELSHGNSFDELISRYPFIPNELGAFFKKGKTKAELGADLIAYAQLAYKRLLYLTDKMIAWVQPMFFIVIAMTIIGTYLALLIPMYSSLETLGAY